MIERIIDDSEDDNNENKFVAVMGMANNPDDGYLVKEKEYGYYVTAIKLGVIPENATIRRESINGSKNRYWYAYWKDNGKLKKKYLGKTFEDALMRPRKGLDVTLSQMKKVQFIPSILD